MLAETTPFCARPVPGRLLVPVTVIALVTSLTTALAVLLLPEMASVEPVIAIGAPICMFEVAETATGVSIRAICDCSRQDAGGLRRQRGGDAPPPLRWG